MNQQDPQMMQQQQQAQTRKIGSGGYGKVYEVEGRVIKVIQHNGDYMVGLPEIDMYTRLPHPYINEGKIFIDEKACYIEQAYAICDMRQFLRKRADYINQNYPDFAFMYYSNTENRIQVAKKWLHQIVQALNCMHNQNILHGDVRASNVLMFTQETVKLADFSLTSRIYPDDDRRRYTIQIVTHRPPEVWLNQKWNLSADIWALACTFYEFLYCKDLFPVQKNENAETYLACIGEFLNRHGMTVPFNYDPSIEFKKAENLENNVIGQLLIFMLDPNPAKRPTTLELLEHPFLHNVLPLEPYMIQKDERKYELSRDVVEYVMNRGRIGRSTKFLACDLLRRIQKTTEINERVMDACIHIAAAYNEKSNVGLATTRLQLRILEKLKYRVNSDTVYDRCSGVRSGDPNTVCNERYCNHYKRTPPLEKAQLLELDIESAMNG